MSRFLLVAIVALLAWPAAGRAQDTEVGIAVFVPTAYFPSAQARSAFATRIAADLSAKLGRPARGLAFARARDLETAIARGDVHVAVLDPLYLASKAAYRPLATAQRGRGGVRMIGVSRLRSSGLPAFRGKRLIVASVSSAEQRFVEGFLLEGQASTAEFFSALTTAPDAASAMAAVAAEQADVALVIDSPEARASAAERGLSVAFSSRSLPGPAVAWVGRAADATLEANVARVARELSAGPLGDGWSAADAGYRGLLAAPAIPRPLFGAPSAISLNARGVLVAPASDLELPAWTPVPAPSPERLP